MQRWHSNRSFQEIRPLAAITNLLTVVIFDLDRRWLKKLPTREKSLLFRPYILNRRSINHVKVLQITGGGARSAHNLSIYHNHKPQRHPDKRLLQYLSEAPCSNLEHRASHVGKPICAKNGHIWWRTSEKKKTARKPLRRWKWAHGRIQMQCGGQWRREQQDFFESMIRVG